MQALLWIAVVLAALWLVLWLGLKIAGFAVHLLLIAAVVLILWWAVRKVF